MKRVLVTGGLGYLGGRIAEHMLKTGNQVRLTTRRARAEVPSSLLDCEVVHMDLRGRG